MLSNFISKYISNRKAYQTEYVFGLDMNSDPPGKNEAAKGAEGKDFKPQS
jgi:hypothetical protein